MATKKGKEKAKATQTERTFTWDTTYEKKLLQICLEYPKLNGFSTHFNWAEIGIKFEAKTGHKLTKPHAKNKFDYMKSLWRNWHDLRFSETGAGWDENLGIVTATDEWWEMKLRESDKYKRFRTKPPDQETSELWDLVYGNICATGANVVSATMDVPVSDSQRNPIDIDTLDDLGVENDGEDEELEQYMREREAQEQPFASGRRPSSSAPIIDSKSKRKKTKASRAAQFIEHMINVDKSNDRLVTLLEGEFSSTRHGPTNFYNLSDAINVVDEMVTEGRLRKSTKLWCFVVDMLNREESRLLFMTLKTNDERMAWLEYKYEEKYPHFVANENS